MAIVKHEITQQSVLTALRNDHNSRTEAELKRRSRTALGIDRLVLVLVCRFLSAIMRG